MAEKRKAEDQLAPEGVEKQKLSEASSSNPVVPPSTVAAAPAADVPDWLKKNVETGASGGGAAASASGASTSTAKRKSASAAAKKKAAAARLNRGNYRCSKCGEPKKGHVCAYQPMRSRAASGPRPVLCSREVQVEMDDDMTVA